VEQLMLIQFGFVVFRLWGERLATDRYFATYVTVFYCTPSKVSKSFISSCGWKLH